VPFPTTDQLDQSHRLHEFAAELRGKFLNGVAWIDIVLAEILAQYFCQNEKRQALFFSEIANDLRFAAKSAVLEKILQREYPKVLASYPRLRQRLDKLRMFRNRLAHAHIDTSEATLNTKTPDEVTFIFYDDGKVKRQRVTRADASRRAKEANQLRSDLVKIRSIILGAEAVD